MKKIFILIFTFALSLPAFSQFGWNNISLQHSSGPVSPEYQYNYTITIDASGAGKLSYTSDGVTNDYNFHISKNSLGSLNKAIVNSKILSMNVDSLSSGKTLIGGQVYKAVITPSSGSEFTIPNSISDKYKASIYNLYEVIEDAVPNSTWNKTGMKPY